MFFVRYFLIKPVYTAEDIVMQIDTFAFIMFVLGYLLLTAGGYAINDYYDIGIDEINKPQKTVLRNILPLSHGLYSYILLTTLGFIVSVYAIYLINSWKLIFVLIIVAFLYWFYSTKYKREFIIGNILVAFLAALSVSIVWLYEFFASLQNYQRALQPNLVLPLKYLKFLTDIILVYSAFAFVFTLLREIVKDIADIDGDKEFNCKTLPVVAGVNNTRIILYVLLIVTVLSLVYVLYLLWKENFIYMGVFSIILIFFVFYIFAKLIKARERKDYIQISDTLKIIFLIGICSIQLFSIEFL